MSSSAAKSSTNVDQESKTSSEDVNSVEGSTNSARDGCSADEQDGAAAADDVPPLPDENPPPLPSEAPPGQLEDDGWEPVWDGNAQAYYFFNRLTKVSQWENPRVTTSTQPGPPGVEDFDKMSRLAPASLPSKPALGGYDPSIHGDYDPDADYAKATEPGISGLEPSAPGVDPAAAYAATGAFNRFTGKWQNADFTPERFNDENKSKRQMSAFFDVDAAANSHDGKSLKAERASKKLSKKELRAFKDKRREKKEEKRRAWLRD